MHRYYLQSLEKKTKLLDDMIRQNGVQEELLKEEDLDMDAFDEAINQQGFYYRRTGQNWIRVSKLSYDRVREELLRDKARYRMEIIRMKELIQQITDKIADAECRQYGAIRCWRRNSSAGSGPPSAPALPGTKRPGTIITI